ncbi:hypothetical protein DBT_2032 [Dissulfuribacter thermophilus]|uniref:Uncharacterized protein n=1 Tax=Dissulfuribacter thermophilus TaxID=1156395 RepID=A0A1B9F403_9BACT|nr:hypothetical protein [Dissulfuribacter thermophilus]OCC14491.1 hypothetical protein DBT_2032 [Dissulfuribacter thermophilus]
MELIEGFDAFFVDEVEAAERRLNIELRPHAKLYLLHLLKRLSENDDFFYSEIVQDRPLGIVLLEALHKNLFEKLRDLKAVGDLSLIFSGLYPEHLTRRLVDIDYFIEIGKKSYYLLSELYSPYKSKQELFVLYSQLVADFLYLIEILTDISGELNFIDEFDVGKAFKRWQRTRISKYREILRRENIIPIDD